jgi:general secretion pathway protein J
MSRGFTLIELLVALFITAIMTSMGYSAVNQALEGRKTLEKQQARIIAVQHAMQLLEQDISTTAARPVRNPLGADYQAALVANATAANSTTSSLSTSTTSNTVSASSLVQSGSTPLSLTRTGWSNPTGLLRTELQRVSYRVEDGKLLRYHLAVLDADAASTATRRELLEQVEALSFRYMDAGHRWSEFWQPNTGTDGVREPRLRYRPVAVEVTLVLKDWGKLLRIIEIPG